VNTDDRYYSSAREDEFAFMFLCESVQMLCRKQDSIALLIGDRDSKKVTSRLSKQLERHKKSGTDLSSVIRVGLTKIVDTVHFTDSRFSRLLQLADLYVWSLQFKLRHREENSNKYKWICEIQKNHFPASWKCWPT